MPAARRCILIGQGSTISAPERATWAFVRAHPAHFIAFGFGSGLAPVGPGTVGTLVALPIYYLLASFLAPLAIAFVAVLLFAVGVWACGRTGTALGVADHGGMNWDEIVAYLLVLAATPPALHWQVVAFVVFRFFDIAKPPPIRALDRGVGGGIGVMLDDLVAALYTVVILKIAGFAVG